MPRPTHIKPIATGGKPPATGYIRHFQSLQRSFIDVPSRYAPLSGLRFVPCSVFNSSRTFSAKEHDLETGYSFFGARYYDADISIWLSVDPMADKAPEISAYAYCFNNPLNHVDPDGRWSEVIVTKYYKDKKDQLHVKQWYNLFRKTIKTDVKITVHNAKFYDAEMGTDQAVDSEQFAKDIEKSMLYAYNSSYLYDTDEAIAKIGCIVEFNVSLKFVNDDGSEGITVVNTLDGINSSGNKPDNLFVHSSIERMANRKSGRGNPHGLAPLGTPFMMIVYPQVSIHEFNHTLGNSHRRMGQTSIDNKADDFDIKNFRQPSNLSYSIEINNLKKQKR